MKKLLLSILFLIGFLAFGQRGQAQTYYQITALTGTQLLGTTTVTVVGTGGNFGFYNFLWSFSWSLSPRQ